VRRLVFSSSQAGESARLSLRRSYDARRASPSPFFAKDRYEISGLASYGAVLSAVVGLVPPDGSKGCTRALGDDHSMTSSARRSSEVGILSPSAFAVLMFITNSNLVGCSTGSSAGFAPLRILST
jgi:hypothetical protein